jgi:type II secretory pathway pseudopilin PulG
MLELLTAIAMIALMAALLLPVLNKGKRNAQIAYDMNNNRQILLAAQMYAADNDDSLPRPGWGTKTSCWASGANIFPGMAPTFERYTNALERQLISFRGGQLYPALKNDRLLRCPADNQINAKYLERNIYISSYVWNSAIVGFSMHRGSRPREAFKLRQFKPEAILEWEADERRPFAFNDFSAYPDEGVSVRHETGGVVGRFDGGAERMSLDEFVAHSGTLAGDFDNAGVGWKKSRIRAPNRLWCSPANHGVPDAQEDSPDF